MNGTETLLNVDALSAAADIVHAAAVDELMLPFAHCRDADSRVAPLDGAPPSLTLPLGREFPGLQYTLVNLHLQNTVLQSGQSLLSLRPRKTTPSLT